MRRMEAIYRDYDLALMPAVEAEEARADGDPVGYAPPRRGIWTRASAGRDDARSILEGFEQTSITLTRRRAGGPTAWELARSVAYAASELLQAHTDEGPVLAGPLGVALPHPEEARAQAALLRDLFGHLFHDDHLWVARLDRTDDAERLARGIYHGRAFADLPILGDALEEAGCSDAAVMEHCREPGAHARGCWVVDALLGRS
jgi:hypothetical protein